MGILGEILEVLEREQPKQGCLFWVTCYGELELAVVSCIGTEPHVLGVPGIGGSILTV